MKSKIIILHFVLLTFIGYQQAEHKKGNVRNAQTEKVHSAQTPDYLTNWVNAINHKNTNSIKNLYDTNAIKIIGADSILNNSTQIANCYSSQKGKITSIESILSIEANKERKINYELVNYKMDNLKEFTAIVIWRIDHERKIREFEFTEESTVEAKKIDTAKIAERRKLWVELCNANNATNLVKQLYTDNTMYYNHKPIVKGTADLIKEYSYMNNKNYRLNLHPIKLKVVNPNFAFEVGRCSGSYNGKYMLIWKKHTDGSWSIYIDSNI
jgi:ketosteroid isomerase-like protein